MRRFAIGDIHGCSKALRTLIDAIDPEPDDELVFLGDYIDRGPDSRDVVDQIISLSERCRVVTLRGNHEIMLLGVALGGLDDSVWLANGGSATVASYGGCLSKIPEDHLHFFQELAPYYETSDAIFVHACYHHQLPLHEQDDSTIYWTHLTSLLPPPHASGKRVVLGHTPQASGEILDGGHVVCIDTYCFGTGFLTAFEMQNGAVIQVDRHGHMRRPSRLAIGGRLRRLGRSINDFCRDQFGRASVEPSEPQVNLVGDSVES